MLWSGQRNIAVVVGESCREAFGDEWSDLLGRKVDDSDNLSVDEVFRLIVVGDLGGGFFETDFGTEIDSEFVCRFASFWEWVGLQNGPDPEFDSIKVGIGDRVHDLRE